MRIYRISKVTPYYGIVIRKIIKFNYAKQEQEIFYDGVVVDRYRGRTAWNTKLMTDAASCVMDTILRALELSVTKEKELKEKEEYKKRNARAYKK